MLLLDAGADGAGASSVLVQQQQEQIQQVSLIGHINMYDGKECALHIARLECSMTAIADWPLVSKLPHYSC